jgi:tungstate transport system ATP-binding protein
MTASLSLDQIEKNYRGVKALESVNFNAQGGKIIVLIGINGAGKTTLLRIIAGLEKPDKGTILFNDKNKSDRELRQIATLVFQRTSMFTRSVYGNLVYGLKIRGKKDPEIKEEISQALHDVGLRDFEKRRAKKTSGGEQQRIALARAFLLEPQILLLDEPTANLDPNSAAIIEKAIVARKKLENIIIISTHNLSQAKRIGDYVIHIHAGRIVEMASSAEFFNNPQSEVSRKFINGELDF